METEVFCVGAVCNTRQDWKDYFEPPQPRAGTKDPEKIVRQIAEKWEKREQEAATYPVSGQISKIVITNLDGTPEMVGSELKDVLSILDALFSFPRCVLVGLEIAAIVRIAASQLAVSHAPKPPGVFAALAGAGNYRLVDPYRILVPSPLRNELTAAKLGASMGIPPSDGTAAWQANAAGVLLAALGGVDFLKNPEMRDGLFGTGACDKDY